MAKIRSAFHDPRGPERRTHGIHSRASFMPSGIETVGAPLPDVTGDRVQAVAVRCVGVHRRRCGKAVLRQIDIRKHQPRVEEALCGHGIAADKRRAAPGRRTCCITSLARMAMARRTMESGSVCLWARLRIVAVLGPARRVADWMDRGLLRLAENRVTVAVVQAGSILFDREKTLRKAADLTLDAAGRGARLVLFPEAFVGGYPKGLDFGARVGSRTPAGREQFRVYYESAMEVPGPCCDSLAGLARDCSVYLVMGVVERDGGTLYCTVLFFAPDGSLLGKHRKLMPTASERLVWGFGDGSTLPVFETPVGRVGAVICWENYMPLLRMAMYGKGIELYCAPTVDDRETWLPTMQHIALEGRCFVLSACQFLRRADRRRQRNRQPVGPGVGRTASRGRSGFDRGPGPWRRGARQVRSRCHRALCAAGCVPVDCG